MKHSTDFSRHLQGSHRENFVERKTLNKMIRNQCWIQKGDKGDALSTSHTYDRLHPAPEISWYAISTVWH